VAPNISTSVEFDGKVDLEIDRHEYEDFFSAILLGLVPPGRHLYENYSGGCLP
jgi:hypothetical protein